MNLQDFNNNLNENNELLNKISLSDNKVKSDENLSETEDTLSIEDNISLTDESLSDDNNFQNINVLEEFEKLSQDLCNKCFIKKKNVQFKPCNHSEFCIDCSKYMDICKICDEEITEKINIKEEKRNLENVIQQIISDSEREQFQQKRKNGKRASKPCIDETFSCSFF